MGPDTAGKLVIDLLGLFLAKGVLQSGLCACLINLSQYAIINEGGPVTSTVVGHFKTCFIVLIGWIVSKRPVTDGSMLGIVMAVGGIIGYVGLLETYASPC